MGEDKKVTDAYGMELLRLGPLRSLPQEHGSRKSVFPWIQELLVLVLAGYEAAFT